jgi:MarR family transcriptional regulator, organic hydroperoxide resistance regulator
MLHNVEVLKQPGRLPMTAKLRTPAASRSREGAADREAWELLVELSMSSLRERFIATAAGLDLSPPQAHALKALRPGHPIAMRQLASTLRCDASNITGIVDRLEARGLVERRVGADDRRVKALVVTPAGEALRARLLERLAEVPAGFSRLSPAEQRQLRDLLRRLVAS